MFHHTHPYEPVIPAHTTKLIVGTLPPPRFTTGDLREGDVDFCYGSRDGLLWPILDRIFNLKLQYETTAEAIAERKNFIKSRGIGICDIVASAKREKVDASDLGMQEIKLRNLIAVLQQHPKIDTLLFTGGNSKNGPEFFFRKHLKEYDISLKTISSEVPRIHSFKLPHSTRTVQTISLTAPSGAANRAIGSISEYKTRKALNASYTTTDFRIEQYQPYF